MTSKSTIRDELKSFSKSNSNRYDVDMLQKSDDGAKSQKRKLPRSRFDSSSDDASDNENLSSELRSKVNRKRSKLQLNDDTSVRNSSKTVKTPGSDSESDVPDVELWSQSRKPTRMRESVQSTQGKSSNKRKGSSSSETKQPTQKPVTQAQAEVNCGLSSTVTPYAEDVQLLFIVHMICMAYV